MAFLPLHILESGARELGIELSAGQLGQLDELASFLVETNRSINLTRITEPAEIVTSHYLDSLTCLAAFEIAPNARAIDVGTGAGMPGIVIAVARPDVSMTLLDSSKKKIQFAAEAAQKLGLANVKTLPVRAEDAGRDRAHRERYDVAFARALADMKVLAELCLPLVKVDGHLVAQKSSGSGEEIAAARAIIGQLGGKISEIARIGIPSTDIVRELIVVCKTKPTPVDFPRPYARIAKDKKQ